MYLAVVTTIIRKVPISKNNRRGAHRRRPSPPLADYTDGLRNNGINDVPFADRIANIIKKKESEQA